MGSAEPIQLSVKMIRYAFARPTKRGFMPTNQDMVKFLMLCKERQLNPWVGDAFLVGFDSNDGPEFSLVTAIEALLKRAELNPNYRGMEAGIIVQAAKGEPVDRVGTIAYEGEKLLGAWCKIYRSDRDMPVHQRIPLKPYDQQRSYWNKNKSWMICKCSKAAGLREAFPSQCGGMYTFDERNVEDVSHHLTQAIGQLSDAGETEQEPERPTDVAQEQMEALKAELTARQKEAEAQTLPEDLSKPPPEEEKKAERLVTSAPANSDLDAEMERHPPFQTDPEFKLEQGD